MSEPATSGLPSSSSRRSSIGAFGFVSFSGTGVVGAPSLTKLYTLPPGLFAGQLMKFQAVGIDPVTGWFRTNCETRLF